VHVELMAFRERVSSLVSSTDRRRTARHPVRRLLAAVCLGLVGCSERPLDVEPDPPSWPQADPAARGPYTTIIQDSVGPGREFTVFRPATLGAGGRRHPVITWGNGTGAYPRIYLRLLDHLASHGFVVVASNQPSVLLGTPPYMIQALNWILQENETPGSVYFERLDPTRIGATGHSQGALATSGTAFDPRVRSIVPIQGASSAGSFSGSALLLCGALDTTTPCGISQFVFLGMNGGPVMYANFTAATHINWLFPSEALHPYVVVVAAWFRAHLMDDAGARAYFYGPSCRLCQDSAWVVERKNM
jgi:hypothetical protein